jgi:hypothetical protein
LGEVGSAIRLVDPTISEKRAQGAVSDEYTPVELLPNVQQLLFGIQQK